MLASGLVAARGVVHDPNRGACRMAYNLHMSIYTHVSTIPIYTDKRKEVKTMTRLEMVETINKAKLFAIHPCNAMETRPDDENAVYYLNESELESMYTESINAMTSNENRKGEKTMKEFRRIEVKQGKKWIESYTTNDTNEINRSLAHDMIAKKLHSCTYIKSIKDRCNYDGTRTITVTYDNDCRSIYCIEF